MIERVTRSFRLPALELCSMLFALAVLITPCSDDDRERLRTLGDSPDFGDLARAADVERGDRLFGQCAAHHMIKMGPAPETVPVSTK